LALVLYLSVMTDSLEGEAYVYLPGGNSTKSLPRSIREEARYLYATRQCTMPEIAEKYDMIFRTVESWHQRDHWAACRASVDRAFVIFYDKLTEEYIKRTCFLGNIQNVESTFKMSKTISKRLDNVDELSTDEVLKLSTALHRSSLVFLGVMDPKLRGTEGSALRGRLGVKDKRKRRRRGTGSRVSVEQARRRRQSS